MNSQIYGRENSLKANSIVDKNDNLKLTLALMYIGKLNKIDAKTIPNDINNALLALKWGLSGCIIQRNLSTAEK